MPKLLERAGRSAEGSITGIYTVLVEGDDFNEPVADSVRSILDGHIVLTRELADQGHYPSIDVLQSVSRLRPDVASSEVVQHGNRVISWLATYRRVQDMVNIGAYVRGSSREIDTALDKLGPVSRFLQQEVEEACDLESSWSELASLM
jgi:flagellum-specific ATP synthase